MSKRTLFQEWLVRNGLQHGRRVDAVVVDLYLTCIRPHVKYVLLRPGALLLPPSFSFKGGLLPTNSNS